jgi:hypothetical protein
MPEQFSTSVLDSREGLSPVSTSETKSGPIILVHGTWGRGFFARKQDSEAPRRALSPEQLRWFEGGSQFRRNLDIGLRSLAFDGRVSSFPWSGSNSVHSRDCAARRLSDVLTEFLNDPQNAPLIIAHSHGGNIALRALEYVGAEAHRVRIITLATPFLQIFLRDKIRIPFLTLVSLFVPILGISWFVILLIMTETAVLNHNSSLGDIQF